MLLEWNMFKYLHRNYIHELQVGSWIHYWDHIKNQCSREMGKQATCVHTISKES